MRLSFEHRIIALPLFAGVGAVAVLATSVGLGRRSARELEQVEQRYYPSIELSRSLESSLAALQRKLQDAVAASDSGAVASADSLAAAFRAELAAARANPQLRSASLDSVGSAFDVYIALASSTTRVMIRGDASEAVMAALPTMTAQFRSLRQSLAAQTAENTGRIGAAFAAARRAQQTSAWVTVGALFAITLGLAILSFGARAYLSRTLRDIASAAQKVAEGDVRQTIAHRSDDVIGAVADSFRAMIAYLQQVGAAADGLARGDLSVQVTPRSESDLVSRNMLRAIETLRALVGDTGALIEAARAGELARRGDAARYDGAYAELVAGTNAMLDAVSAPTAEARAVLERVAERDLTARMAGVYRGDHAAFQSALNSALDRLRDALAEVASASLQVSDVAGGITTSSESLASSASRQAEVLERFAGRMQEITERTRGNSGRAQEARGLVSSTVASSRESSRQVGRMTDAMGRISASSSATARIVKTIDEIAFQTNLLALNAAVEAARAGDAGRGFAVVAEEVRSLALRSAEAARQTAQLIEEAVKDADGGAGISGEVARQLREIDAQIARVDEVVSGIALASDEQMRSMEQLGDAVVEMRDATQRTASQSEESAAAATEMSGQAESLRGLVGSFRIGEGGRRSSPRAAVREALVGV